MELKKKSKAENAYRNALITAPWGKSCIRL